MILPSREFSKAIFIKFLRAGLSPWLQNLRGSRKVSIGYLILLILNLLMILIMLVLNGLPKQNNTIIYQIFRAINTLFNLLLFQEDIFIRWICENWIKKQFILTQSNMTDLIAQNRSFESNKVKIYIRGYSKKACKLTICNDAMISDLKRIIKEKMDISEDNQLLFWKGKQLHNDLNVKFQPLSIIHVVNKKRINLGQISLFIKKVDDSTEIYTYTVQSEMKVGQFQEKNLCSICGESEDWFLVYTGKRLDPKKSFKEEMVEDESEILLVKKANILDHVENKLAERQVHLIRNKSIEKFKQKSIDLYKEKQFKGLEKCDLLIPQSIQNEQIEVSRQKSLQVQLSSANAQHSIASSATANIKNVEQNSISNEPEVGNQEKNEQELSEMTEKLSNAKIHRAYSQAKIGLKQTPIEHVFIHKNPLIQQETHEQQQQGVSSPIYEFSLYDLLVGNEPQLKSPVQNHQKIEQEIILRLPEQITEIHSENLQNKEEEVQLQADRPYNEKIALKNQEIFSQQPILEIKKGQNSIDFIEIMNQRTILKTRHYCEPQKILKKEIVKKYNDGQQIRELIVDHKDRPTRILNRSEQHTTFPSNSNLLGMLNPQQQNSAHPEQSEETDDRLVYSMKGNFNGLQIRGGLDQGEQKNREINYLRGNNEKLNRGSRQFQRQGNSAQNQENGQEINNTEQTEY